MSSYTDGLYQLLPAIYRIHDAEQGDKLRALLEIIGEQADVMDADIVRLYDNLFIETCEEWVVPYLGDLLGVRGLHPVSDATYSQRARVANTLSYRRRKGTAAMLEQLARDTSGWNARVVEFFQHLGTTQHINHRRPQNLRAPDLRDGNALELIGTPFDTTTRTADVRHINNCRGQFNLPNIGIFFWRLQAYPVDRAPAFDHGEGRFSFSQLGHDAPLFNRPVTEKDIVHLAEEINVPAPIRRRGFLARKKGYYGKDQSIFIWVNAVAQDSSKIVPCDLTDWTRRPEAGCIAVDPELGRIAFPIHELPENVEVNYAYGFSADVGGGFYNHEHTPDLEETCVWYPIAKSKGLCDSLKMAIETWNADGRPSAVFIIRDSAFYEEKIEVSLPAGVTLEIRAGQNDDGEQQRPVLLLKAPFTITGETQADKPGATLLLDGLWIGGNKLQVDEGDLGALQFRHCTLVPGWGLRPDGTPTGAGEASLYVDTGNNHLQVAFDLCIAGKLKLASAVTLAVRDSIVAAADDVAITAPTVTVERSTVLGRVEAEVLQLASDSIFSEVISAERTQKGCVRFSYLPRDSKVPRRFRCQPDLAIQQAEMGAIEQGKSLSEGEETEIATRLRPVFTSDAYGTPWFCQLHQSGPREIFTGAHDESEMGVFHHLHQPQRETNLRASLDEYLRAGLEAGIFYVN